MSVDHTFIVLDTSGHIETIRLALADFTSPFIATYTEPTRAVSRPVPLADGRMGYETWYSGGDVRVQMEGIPTPISNRRCNQIFMALLNENLTQSVNYLEVAEPDHALACAMFDTTTPDIHQIAALDSLFSHPYIDALIADIHNHLSPVFQHPWREWKLVESNGFYALIGGRDYRVVEWERMTQVPSDEGMDHEFDMNSLLQYIATLHAQQTNLPSVSYTATRDIIYDLLRRLTPGIEVKKAPSVSARLDPVYITFVNNVVEPAVRTFVNATINPIIRSRESRGLHHTKYSGVISDRGVFVLTEHKPTLSDKEQERQEIINAIANQDFVPERLRRQYNL